MGSTQAIWDFDTVMELSGELYKVNEMALRRLSALQHLFPVSIYLSGEALKSFPSGLDGLGKQLNDTV